jgi:hypothetical protein
MERIVDKVVVLACCLACFAVLPWGVALLLALLCSVAASALGEVLPRRLASVPALAYALAPLPAVGVIGIWAAIPIGWALADAIGIGYYFARSK